MISHQIQLAELIQVAQAPVVCDVEEVSNEANLRAFVDHPRIICVQIELSEERSPPEFASSTRRNYASVQVNRMRQILADRYPRLHVETHAEVESIQEPATKSGAVFTERVARVDIRHEAPIGIEITDLKLIAESVEIACGKVKQRTGLPGSV